MSEVPVTPGKITSEHKVTWVVIVTSIVLPTLHYLLGAIKDSGVIENTTAVTIIGLVATLLSGLGYTGARAMVKTNALKADAARSLSLKMSPPTANPPPPTGS